MRRAMRVDRNQREIIEALRKCGASVLPIHAQTAGCPDLLVGFNGRNFLVEVKVPKTGRLSEGQKAWRDNWRGGKPFIIRDAYDVQMFIELI